MVAKRHKYHVVTVQNGGKESISEPMTKQAALEAFKKVPARNKWSVAVISISENDGKPTRTTVRQKNWCKNCGDETNLADATGDRQHLGYCVPCHGQVSRIHKDRYGTIKDWPDERTKLYKKNPWDSRG